MHFLRATGDDTLQLRCRRMSAVRKGMHWKWWECFGLVLRADALVPSAAV